MRGAQFSRKILGFKMDDNHRFQSAVEDSAAHGRKPWETPRIIMSEGRETNHNIPFGGTPDGSLTSINYAYGS